MKKRNHSNHSLQKGEKAMPAGLQLELRQDKKIEMQ